jgi:hypothetical protein
MLTALPLAQALALEAATVGSQASQAVVGAINSKVDTSIAALQAQITGMQQHPQILCAERPEEGRQRLRGNAGLRLHGYQ